jgi:outer membrane protein assembly factor BamD (BamD/ComL family)
VYGLSKQPDKAKEPLKEFIEKYKNSPFLSMAKARLNDYSS